MGALSPYVSAGLATQVASGGAGYWERDGTLVFADISGFTKLSELLAQSGREGAEELTLSLNTAFTALLRASEDGGDLLHFGGDALLLHYEGDDHARRAVHAAAAMRAALKGLGAFRTSKGQVRLKMSIAVNSGPCLFMRLGTSSYEVAVLGPTATGTTNLEGIANAGEIALGPVTAAALKPSELGAAIEGGYLLKKAPSVTPHPMRLAPEGADLGQLIPAVLRGRMETLEHEHRPATVSFIHIDGVDDRLLTHSVEDVHRELDAVVTMAQDTAAEHGVAVLASDITSGGMKLILVGGAPDAHDDDETRVLLASRAIVDRSTLPIRAGVNRGRIFSGDVGSPERRAYTIMGDTVNLAARLMGKAKLGEVVAHESVLARLTTGFETDALEPFMVKGKTELIHASRVIRHLGGAAHTAASEHPFVGRESELEILETELEKAAGLPGRVIDLVGEAGMGKSRLMNELIARHPEARLLHIKGETYSSTTPYRALRSLLRPLLGLTEASSPEAAGAALIKVLSSDGVHLPWAPLLAMPLGASVPATREVDELATEFRSRQMHTSLLGLLRRALPGQHTLIYLEDAFLFDDVSADALAYVLDKIEEDPWLAVTTRRIQETGLYPALGYKALELPLGPLDESAAGALLDHLDQGTSLRKRLGAMSGKAAGNPLFLLELAAAGTLEDDEVPDNVESMILARLDRLPDEQRKVLRHLAVLGSTATNDLVDVVLSDLGKSSRSTVILRLSEFLARDGSTISFRHDLFREVAYSALTYQRRRRLHSRVADWIEEHAADDDSLRSSLLSLHYYRAARWNEAFDVSVHAGRTAQAAYANDEAAIYYERALEAARHREQTTRAELAELNEALADVDLTGGAFADARKAYRDTLKLVEDTRAKARIQLQLGVVIERSGDYSASLRQLARARTVALDIEDAAERSAMLCRIDAHAAGIRYRQGKLRECVKLCLAITELALVHDDREILARAYFLLDGAYTDLGDPNAATYRELALPIYEERGDLVGQATVLNNLGIDAYFEGKWVEARELYERSRDLHRRSGNIVLEAVSVNNIGEILSDQGLLEEATADFQEALRTWRWSNYPIGIALATSNLGRAAVRAGRLEEAEEILLEAERLFAELGSNYLGAEAFVRRIELAVASGHAETAATMAEQALELPALGGGATPLLATALRLKSQALALAGKASEAAEAIERSISTARACAAEFELALSLLVASRPGDEGFEEAESILDGLGVRDRSAALVRA